MRLVWSMFVDVCMCTCARVCVYFIYGMVYVCVCVREIRERVWCTTRLLCFVLYYNLTSHPGECIRSLIRFSGVAYLHVIFPLVTVLAMLLQMTHTAIACRHVIRMQSNVVSFHCTFCFNPFNPANDSGFNKLKKQ